MSNGYPIIRHKKQGAAAEAEEGEAADEGVGAARAHEVDHLGVALRADDGGDDRAGRGARDDLGQQLLLQQRGDHAQVLHAHRAASGEEEGGRS